MFCFVEVVVYFDSLEQKLGERTSKRIVFSLTFAGVVQGEKINEVFLFGREGSELRDHCPLLKPGRVIDGLVNSSECPLKKQHFFGDFDWFRLEMGKSYRSRTKTKLRVLLH